MNENPITDTCGYCVEFDDGEVSELTATVILESMYAAFDGDNNKYLIMVSIVDYRKNNKVVTISDQKVVHRGQNSMWCSNSGWHLCVQWRDCSTS